MCTNKNEVLKNKKLIFALTNIFLTSFIGYAFASQINFPWKVSSLGTPPPAATARGSSRTNCGGKVLELPIVAMVPSNQSILLDSEAVNSSSVRMQTDVGLTFSSHPTFWFYIPDLPSNIKEAKFRLQRSLEGGGQEDLFTAMLPIDTKSAIIGFQLPDTAEPLELGSLYRWIVSVTCTEGQVPLFAEAWIARKSPAFTPGQLPMNEEVELYASHGYLHETLTYLALLRNQDPDFINIWSVFLDELNLDEIREEPNIKIISLSNNSET